MQSASLRSFTLLSWLAAGALVYLGCGGKVVVDAAGAGGDGAGGDTTTTTSFVGTTTSTGIMTSTGTGIPTGTATSSTGTGSTCGDLAQAYEKALFAAKQCNACKNFDGCINGPVFQDTCGCPVALDSSNEDLLVAAKEADGAWLSAGCMPFACGKPCFIGMSWGCQANMGGDCAGTCAPN